MSGFISKVTRLAASKAAAFGYAVAVGVAGNIAFHYVEPPASPPATTASVAARPAPDATAPVDAAIAAPAPPATQILPTVAARPEPKPAPPRRQVEPHRTVASAPVLPEPPTPAELPRTDALLSPVLRPAALPKEAATPPAAPPASRPAPVPVGESAAATPVPATTVPATAVPASAADPAPVTLPPLGPAIEVDAPPTPPTVDAPTADAPSMPAPSAATGSHALSKKAPLTQPRSTAPPDDLEISDLWHPGRAVRRGLHWAGRQVPLIGDGDDGKPTMHPAAAPSHSAVAGPIPLLPTTGEPPASGQADAAPPPRKPAAPGPGSGGLY